MDKFETVDSQLPDGIVNPEIPEETTEMVIEEIAVETEAVTDTSAEISDSTVTKEQPHSFAKIYKKTEFIIGKIILLLYHLRKIVMAAPVVYAAVKLAYYNMDHLPEQVGVNLMASGEFATHISRDLAVMGPLGITIACLLLMFCSRKAMYAWAISIFTLVLPLLLLVSNQYPM